LPKSIKEVYHYGNQVTSMNIIPNNYM